jgi:hypothetical protein
MHAQMIQQETDMETSKRIARTIAVLLLVQMACGPLVNFGLLGPVTSAPGFLVNAAANAWQASLAAMLGLMMGGLFLAIAITAWPLFRRYSERMALGLIALAAVGCSLAAVESASVLSMLSLSQAYAKAGIADGTAFQVLAIAVGSARKWAHYIHLIVEGGAIILMYSVLYRFALIPRALAAFGLFAAILLPVTVAISVFGHAFMFAMLVPLGLSQLALVAWLLLRGLNATDVSERGTVRAQD